MKKPKEPWTIRSSNYILKDKWVNVRADDCLTADGTEVSPYYVFECPDWAIIVAFDEQMRVLVIEQYRHGLGGATYEFPGGILDEESDCPDETVRRELLEETGCQVGDLHLLASISPNPATHANKAHMYVGFDCRQVAEAALEPAEDITFEFLELDELYKRIDDGRFQQGNHMANLFLAIRKAKVLGKLKND